MATACAWDWATLTVTPRARAAAEAASGPALSKNIRQNAASPDFIFRLNVIIEASCHGSSDIRAARRRVKKQSAPLGFRIPGSVPLGSLFRFLRDFSFLMTQRKIGVSRFYIPLFTKTVSAAGLSASQVYQCGGDVKAAP